MYCQNCGFKLEMNSKFCVSCGKPIEPGEQLQTQIKAKPRNHKSVIFWAIWSILAFQCVIMVLYAFSIVKIILFVPLLSVLVLFRKKLFRNFFASLGIWTTAYFIFLVIVGLAGQSTSGKLYSKEFQPSENEQIANFEGLSIKIPGGLLLNKETLEIYDAAAKTEPLIKGMKQVDMVDIQLGKLTKFSKSLTIEMKYDKALLKGDIPSKNQFAVCYYDEKLNGWVETPFEVDEEREVLVIKTNHLTKWSAYYTLWGYDTYPGKTCTVIYDKKGLKNDEAQYIQRTDREGNTDSVPVLIKDIALFIDQAYASYEQEGIKLPKITQGQPETKINIYVGDLNSSYLGTLSGIICINQNLIKETAFQAQGADQKLVNAIRHDCAHELFHVAQSQKLDIKALHGSPKAFWIEAAADYAADRIAWKHAVDRDGSKMSRTEGMGGDDVKSTFLQFSLFTFNKKGTSYVGHEYASAHFVDYVMKQYPQVSPQVLINMLDRDPNFEVCFNDYFGKDGKTLEKWLSEYAYYFLFDKASPFPKESTRNDALDDYKGLRFKMKNDTSGQLEQNEINDSFVLKPAENYSAWVVLTDLYIEGKTDKENEQASFELKLKSDKEVRVVLTGSKDKAAAENQVMIGGTSPEEAVLNVKGQKKIYLLYTVGKNIEPAKVTVTAKYIQGVVPEITVDPALASFDLGSSVHFMAGVKNGPKIPYFKWEFGDGAGASEGINNQVDYTYQSPGEFDGFVYLYDADTMDRVLAQKRFRVTVSKTDSDELITNDDTSMPSEDYTNDNSNDEQPSQNTQDSYDYEAALAKWINDFTASTNKTTRDEYWGQDHIYTLKFTIAPNIKLNGPYGEGIYGAHEIWDHWTYYTGDRQGQSGDSIVNTFAGVETGEGIYCTLDELRSRYPQY